MTKKATKKRKGVTREQIWKLWKAIGPQGWYDMAQEFKRDHHFTFYKSDVLKGRCPCPDHEDTSPSFYVYVDKGYVRCFGCNYYSSSPVALGSLLMDIGEKETLGYFKEHYHITFMSAAEIAEFELQSLNQETKQIIYKAAHAVMCDSVLDPKKYPSTSDAIKWLTQTRQLDTSVLHALPMGVMPSLEELKNVVKDQFQTAHLLWEQNPNGKSEPQDMSSHVFEYLKDVYTNVITNGSVVWPLHSNPREIARLKMRAPHSRDPKQIIMPLDPYEDSVGLFGVGWEPYNLLGSAESPIQWVYLTEGEFDVISYMAKSLEAGPNIVLYSVGGAGGATEIEPILRSMGVKGAYLIGDSPYKGKSGGDVVVREWLRRMLEVHSKVFTGWDALSPSLDLDEAVLQNGLNKVDEVLWQTPSEYFTPSWQWAADAAIKELSGIDEDDKRTLLEKATIHGQCLRHKTDIDAFVEEICEHYNIKETHLKREIASNEDTEVGFVQRCMHALSELTHVVATKSSTGGREISLFNKETETFHDIRLDSDISIAQELAPITGPLINFVEEKVGFPTFIESPIGSDNIIYNSVDKSLRFYMRQACLGLAQGVPDLQSAMVLKQGYHYIKTGKNEGSEYIVCGTDIFKLVRESLGLQFVKLEGPSDSGIVFDIGFNRAYLPWFPKGLTTTQLEQGPKENIEDLYNELVNFFDIGFKFKRHELTVKLLATLLIIFPVLNAFPRQLLLFFTGDSHSGKSHLINVFSGYGNEGIQLLYCAIGMANYTGASVFNMMNGDTRLLALDEFESTDPQKARAVDMILQHYRGLVTGSTGRITATMDGDFREVHHEHPIIFSAITGADKAQDLNRLLIVEMDKIEGREKPTVVLKQHYGIPGIESLAKRVAVAAYPLVPQLVQHYRDIEREFINLQSLLPFRVENRYASSLFFSLTVLKYMGHDWKAFFKEFVTQNESIISRAATVSESESYLKAMMYNSVIFPAGNEYPVSVSQLLAIPDRRSEINLCGCGVYFDAENKYLLILIEQALAKLMPSNKARNITGNRLKDALERHKAAVSHTNIKKSGILTKVVPYMGADIGINDVVVLHADRWLQSAQQGIDKLVQDTKETKEKENEKKTQNNDW